MASGGITFRRLAAALMVLGLAASACTGSATVTQTGASSGGEPVESVVDPGDTPAPQSTSVDTPESTVNPAVEPTAAPVATAEPAQPTEPLPAAEFRSDSVLGIANSGTHAYAGTTSVWETATACADPVAESLSVVDIGSAVDAPDGVVPGVAAGLTQSGDVRQLLSGPDARAAILSSCGPTEDPTLWLNLVEFGSDGRIVELGEQLPVGANGESDPYLLWWIDDDTIEVRVIIEVDPTDGETWIYEHRAISMSTGQTAVTATYGVFEEDQAFGFSELSTADGRTYRSIEDPAQGIGCEGFGVASTIELDDGTVTRLALTQPGLVFSDVTNLHLATTGHIAWTSSCEGFVSAYVGKVIDDGSIADAHLIETYGLAGSDSADYYFYRLTNDGFLAAVGQTFDYTTSESSPAFLYYDLSADPHFINTADPAPQIDAEPLFEAVNGEGAWHVGDTLSSTPACGGRTLYGKTVGGFVRAFPIGQELDGIVGADFGETRVVTYDFGDDFVSRTVVVQTECPGSYEGRQVWFGIEFGEVVWGLSLQRADLGEVARVVAVRDVIQEGTDFVERSIVEVELLDGGLVEVELVGLPFDS